MRTNFVTVQVTVLLRDNHIAQVLLDRLSTPDDVNDLADAIIEEVRNNKREETFGMLCRRILGALGQ